MDGNINGRNARLLVRVNSFGLLHEGFDRSKRFVHIDVSPLAGQGYALTVDIHDNRLVARSRPANGVTGLKRAYIVICIPSQLCIVQLVAHHSRKRADLESLPVQLRDTLKQSGFDNLWFLVTAKNTTILECANYIQQLS